jgi:hypothetical protein
MWIVWTGLGIVSAVVIAVLVVSARRPSTPKRLRQPDLAGSDHGELPEPGSDEVPHRSDGTVMPGSEEYRNRQGKP